MACALCVAVVRRIEFNAWSSCVPFRFLRQGIGGGESDHFVASGECVISTQFCDVCRQYHAMVDYTDLDASGTLRERHVCASCFRGYDAPYTTVTELIDLQKHIIENGHCEKCGGRADIVSGVPGAPDRIVLCCSPVHEQTVDRLRRRLSSVPIGANPEPRPTPACPGTRSFFQSRLRSSARCTREWMDGRGRRVGGRGFRDPTAVAARRPDHGRRLLPRTQFED